MDKSILTPQKSDEERAIIQDICSLVSPKCTKMAEKMLLHEISEFLDSDYTYDVECRECAGYNLLRMKVLIRLLQSISDARYAERGRRLKSEGAKLDTYAHLVKYAYTSFDLQSRECMIILFLDKNFEVKDAFQCNYCGKFICGFKREAVESFVKENSPGRFVIIHSHPGISVEPSDFDIAFTEKIREYAFLMGSELIEHFVVSCTGDVTLFSSILRDKKAYSGGASLQKASEKGMRCRTHRHKP